MNTLMMTREWIWLYCVNSNLWGRSGTMRAARWVPWLRPLFPKPAPSRGRAERGASATASASDFTPSSGMEMVWKELSQHRHESFPLRGRLIVRHTTVLGQVLIFSMFDWSLDLRFDAFMDYSIPEILRVPLEELCLHIMVCKADTWAKHQTKMWKSDMLKAFPSLLSLW